MLRKNSLRSRYIVSLLFIMVPILIFSFIMYASNYDRSVQYINQSALQNFTYATENISAVLNRLNYTAQTAFAVEQAITTDSEGNITVTSDSVLCAALQDLEPSVAKGGAKSPADAVFDGDQADGKHGKEGDGAVKGQGEDLDVAQYHGKSQHHGALAQSKYARSFCVCHKNTS